MELPGQIKKHRNRLGLSQEDLARTIFVSRQTVSNWETGKTYPDIQSLLLLSSLFDVSVDELLKGDVALMESKINKDSLTMKRLAWAMVSFIVAAVIAGGCAIIFRDIGTPTDYDISVGSLICVILVALFFICAFAAAIRVEVIKRKNDLVTFREITTFMKGKSVDEAKNEQAFGRRHPVISVVQKICIGIIAGVAAYIVFSIIAKMIRDFIFIP